MRLLSALLSPFSRWQTYDRLPGPVSLASSPPNTPPSTQAPWTGGKRSGRQRAGPGLIIFAVGCLLLILFGPRVEGWEAMKGMKVGSLGLLPDRLLDPPVQVLLLVDGNSDSIRQVTERVLAMTVGPYELTGVFTGADRETSSSLVERIVDAYLSPNSSTSLPSSLTQRPLLAYKSYIAPTDIHATHHSPGYRLSSHSRLASFAQLSALASLPPTAAHAIVLNANDLLETYGYDRLLLSAMVSEVSPSASTTDKEYHGLIGVSGRAGANVLFSNVKQAGRLTDSLGEPQQEDHAADLGEKEVMLRQVAMRAPIIRDVQKAEKVGWWGETIGALGMGDLDLCLRSASHDFACGYYPISTSTDPSWGLVPGTPNFGLELELGDADMSALDLKGYAKDGHFSEGGGEMGSVPFNDASNGISTTIISAITPSSLPHFFQLHSTLQSSLSTRVILYLVPTPSFDIDALTSLQDLVNPSVDIRDVDDASTLNLHFFSSPNSPESPDGAVEKQTWQGLGIKDKLRLTAEAAAEFGGLVLWVDPDREVGSDVMRVWEESAEKGIWVGSAENGTVVSKPPANALHHLGIPDSVNLTMSHKEHTVYEHTGEHGHGAESGMCDAGVIGIHLAHPVTPGAVLWPLLECASSADCLPESATLEDEATMLSYLLKWKGISCDRPTFPRQGTAQVEHENIWGDESGSLAELGTDKDHRPDA